MIQLKHLCAYLPYGLKYYPSEKSDLFHDLYANHAMDSTWDYIHALENNDEYALKIKSSYLIPCDTFIATEDGEIFLGQFKSSLGFDVDDVFLSEVKPILRPMSDFWDTSQNWMQQVRDIDNSIEFWSGEFDSPCNLPYVCFEVIIRNHFDVFDLLSQNLAISIHDLEK